MSHISPMVLFNVIKNIPKKHKQLAIDILLQSKAEVESLFDLKQIGSIDIYTIEINHEKLTMIDYRWYNRIELGLRKHNKTTTAWLS
jgi:hypothetical protein